MTDTDSDSSPGPTLDPATGRSPRRVRPVRLTVMAVLTLLVLWAVAASVQVAGAARSANRGKALLTEFRKSSGGSLAGLEPLTSTPDLSKVERANADFRETSRRLRSPLVRPLRYFPVLGRQLGVVLTLSDSSRTLTSALVGTFDEVQKTLDTVKALPTEERVRGRLAAAVDMERALHRLITRVESLDSGDHRGLAASVGNARDEFISNRHDLVVALSRALDAVAGTRAFLAGPNTYVVLAANNAEMRAGSGMFLQAGSMTIEDGEFRMGDLRSTGDMVLDQPATEFDPALQALWGDFRPTAEWRNINLTARFDESGRIATEMWHAAGNPPAQGALAVDIWALKRLLRLVGPITVERTDGTPVELDADNVAGYLLLQQYKDMDSDNKVGQDERRSHLGVVAKAVFESLNHGDVGLDDLLDALVAAGRGRHLLAWSSDPVQQRAWEELGLSGELPVDGLLVSLINRGANKLDQFVTVNAALSAERTGDLNHLTLALALQNTTPPGLPAFVAGGTPASGVRAGDYVGYLALNVPLGAGNFTVDGGELLATAVDGDTRVLIVHVVVPMGGNLSLTIGMDLPTSWRSLQVLPSARIPAVAWSFADQEWEDRAPRRISLP